MEKIEVVYSEGRLVAPDPDRAPRLYREGFYGRPVGVEKPKTMDFRAPVQLSFYEALYLLEKGRIRVVDPEGRTISYEELLREAERRYEGFRRIYSVYRDLRMRGYVARPGVKFGATFAVYEYGPGIDHAPFLVEVLPEDARISAIDIVGAGRLTHTVRKKLLLALPKAQEIVYLMFSWRRM